MKQLRLNHAHKIFNNTCPSYLKNNFVRINEHHRYGTRSSHYNFVIPKIKGNESTSFYYNAIQDWNSLPESIKSISDHKRFKKEVKCHLKCTSEELENDGNIFWSPTIIINIPIFVIKTAFPHPVYVNSWLLNTHFTCYI